MHKSRRNQLIFTWPYIDCRFTPYTSISTSSYHLQLALENHVYARVCVLTAPSVFMNISLCVKLFKLCFFSEYSCAYKRFLRAKTSVNPWRSQLAIYPGGHRASIPSQLRSEERMLFLSRNEIIIIKQNRGHLKSLEHSNKSCLCNGLDLVFVRAKSFCSCRMKLEVNKRWKKKKKIKWMRC